jgi:DNA-binding NarL/FixJ family response regulator
MLNILIVDDHQVAISGVMNAISGLPDFRIINQFSRIQDVMVFLESNTIDIVITDLYFDGGEPDGIGLTVSIKQKYPNVKVLMFSGEVSNGKILSSAYQADIDGYIPKNAPLHELVMALHALGKEQKYFNQEILLKIVDYSKNKPQKVLITAAENVILKLLDEGKTRKEITGELLNRSTGTYDTHLFHLKQKFNVKSTIDLLKKARQLEMLSSEQ